MRYKFISFEGVDGCGKTTLRDELICRLQSQNVPATSVGQNSWLSVESAYTIPSAREKGKTYSPEKMIASYAADKLLHYTMNVQNMRKFGVVISDRFYISDVVYMNVLHGVPMDRLCGEFLSGGYVWPDYIYFIDVAPGVANSRIEKRGKARRHYEREADLSKLYETYLRFFSVFADRIPSKVSFIKNETDAITQAVNLIIEHAEILSNPLCSQIAN